MNSWKNYQAFKGKKMSNFILKKKKKKLNVIGVFSFALKL